MVKLKNELLTSESHWRSMACGCACVCVWIRAYRYRIEWLNIELNPGELHPICPTLLRRPPVFFAVRDPVAANRSLVLHHFHNDFQLFSLFCSGFIFFIFCAAAAVFFGHDWIALWPAIIQCLYGCNRWIDRRICIYACQQQQHQPETCLIPCALALANNRKTKREWLAHSQSKYALTHRRPTWPIFHLM